MKIEGKKPRTAVRLCTYDTHKPLNVVTTHIKKYFKGKCLDVGYNNGRHLKLMPKGSVGIDLDSRYNKCLEDYKLITFDLNVCDLPLKESEFDVILCSHVLEHIDSPHLLLKEFKRICKKGGYIIIAVPNAKCISKDFYGGEFKKFHINAWDYYTLKKILEVHNLRISQFLINHPTNNKTIGKLFQLNINPLKKRWEDLWFVCKNIK